MISTALPAGPAEAATRRDAPPLPVRVPPSEPLSVQLAAVPDIPLSPFELQILSLCLQSPEDPGDVGVLNAMLGAGGTQDVIVFP